MDQRYLLGELMPISHKLEDRIYREIIRLSNKAVIERIRQMEDGQKEYREYIEQWVHEVKTPITAARLLCENHPGEAARAVLAELEKVDRFTQQTLYYARSEHTEKDYVIREVRLSDVVHGAIADNKYLLRQNGVTIEMDNVTDTVYTDDKWVRFILNQLIGNAVKYRSENPRLRFSTREQDFQVQLVMEDNGIGIGKADLPRVFEKGFTGENGRSIQSATGIGLYLCRRLCDKLGIGLALESDGGGTTVLLSFQVNHFLHFC